MILLFRPGAPRDEVERLRALLLTAGCELREIESGGRGILLADKRWEEPPVDLISRLKASPWVERIVDTGRGYALVSADARPDRSSVRVGEATFGGGRPELIAGPCTVEDYETVLETARAVRAAGARALRGGVYKPTTSPYSYSGPGAEGLEIMKAVREETGLAIVTEAMDPRQVEAVGEAADMIQIGSRNMQNFDLLREVGRQPKPVLLKRGMAATVEEWLCAAEYIAREGNEQIVLCERGIRTFERATRNTLDVSAIPIVRLRSHLPVIADPSHSAGDRRLVAALALAAVAAGADGLLIEVHPRPEQAVKDGAQTISTDEFSALAERVFRVAAAVSRADDAVRAR
ncbi:MAG: 3-deoxy-7-phosphoheptulonate synthase [Armatimonadetes bacterium]|nr:3-deoxy-7-phosphoheptulonate synthase [Armatimonadota bacterium]